MSKKLFDKISQASALINNTSRISSANYTVVSKEVDNILKGFRRGYRKEKINKIFND